MSSHVYCSECDDHYAATGIDNAVCPHAGDYLTAEEAIDASQESEGK